ncbi:hypothetical protein B0H15DRAFT_1023721 [Mycena belliarum]|uniref:Uncharacterized protein n=1 Tax=Mycena belliarum TaxID=1033014 RepID=A0AAD6XMD0_9AGAR|nr:hypothetical protein B0H15DRAFT_1023721 [Mycena belliae]
MSATATFSNIAVSTTFDNEAATSSISQAWVLKAGLDTCNSVASGLVTIPCDGGVISMSMNVPVAASLSHDLVFGMDWLQFLRAAAPQLVVHLGLWKYFFNELFISHADS